MKSHSRVLFLGKSMDRFCSAALSFCRENFECVEYHLGAWGDPFPEAREWSGDYIISYLSRWIVPEEILKRARIAAVNFHPASPEFPGIGCCNFALYNLATEYGVTCHHMTRRVDTGPIIAVKRFPMSERDNVATLLARTYEAQFDLFLEIGLGIRMGDVLPVSSERWSRTPFTRKEFDALNRLSPEMDESERAKRIRSCAFQNYFPIEESQMARAA